MAEASCCFVCFAILAFIALVVGCVLSGDAGGTHLRVTNSPTPLPTPSPLPTPLPTLLPITINGTNTVAPN